MANSASVKVADIVRDAGGRVIGRTRLQKIAYLLSATGYDDSFSFAYKHYGPYSDALADAAREADLLGFIVETEQEASWGGKYSIYEFIESPDAPRDAGRNSFAQAAAASGAIELELAATAVFLAKEGFRDPWGETARRKPEKAEGDRLDKARHLYAKLAALPAPVPLPVI